MDSSASLDDFISMKSEECGDFINAEYSAKKEKDKIILERKGKVSGKALSITKEIRLKSKNQIEVSYSLKNLSKSTIDMIFGSEFNFTMPYLNSNQYSYIANEKFLSGVNDQGVISGPSSFSIKDSSKEIKPGETIEF